VREWTGDWYAAYPESLEGHYTPPTSGQRRAIRGGSYRTSAPNSRAFHRMFLPPTFLKEDVGIRLACDYPPPQRGEVAIPPVMMTAPDAAEPPSAK